MISVNDRLPKDKTYVLVHVNRDNWIDRDDPKNVCFKVMKFVRGISKEERDTMPDCERKRWIRPEDEYGNNLKPYYWREFGPGSEFGQNVDYWMDLPELRVCQ